MTTEKVKKSVVVIGGGTGTHTILRGLKKYCKNIDLAAVVTMADSGGSTGRLRDEFGYLPVGDVRMALVALAKDDDEHHELVRQLFLHRFDKGNGLHGHNFGNLFLVALTDILGSEEAAILAASRILRIQGQVIPVTKDNVHLVAEYDDGVVITGEHDIDEPIQERNGNRIINLSVTPKATINSHAEDILLKADLIVLGPGDLYTSVLANCVIDGVAEAIKHSRAKALYVCNLMTKSGQTTGMTAQAHIDEISHYIGKDPDIVLVNNGDIPKVLQEKYASELEFPVAVDCSNGTSQIVIDDFLATEEVRLKSGDKLKRSLVRHDSNKLAQTIINFL